MKKFYLSILIATALFSGVGEITSKRESFQAQVKVELIKEDDSTVTILDGSKFIELKTIGTSTALAQELTANRPENGTYKGVKYTVNAFKHKIKLVAGGITYYTTTTTKNQDESWNLSQNDSDYGYTTTNAPSGGFVTNVTFPKPLVLSSGSDANLVFVNQYLPNNVKYETNGNVESSNWIDETTKATAFLPSMPTKIVSFDVIYSKSGTTNLTNTVTAFLDSENDLIGAYMMRPSDHSALNGSFMLSGTKTNDSYNLKFQNGDDSEDSIIGDDYYLVSGTLNCTNTTYSNLSVNEVSNGGTATEPNNLNSYSLTTTGSFSCANLNL